MIQDSSWRINLPGGGTITLENYPTSAFDVQLLDVPVKPQTSTLITGDLEPVDCDENEPGVQARYDAWGNIVTDPQEPAPGRADVLFDTSGDDRIEGLGGNDYIRARQGGNDWLVGGDGSDFVGSGTATGRDIIEGGTGSDVLWGGLGDDQVFAEQFAEMEAIIAGGEIASSDQRKRGLGLRQ